jgi:hypothetical protein
VILGAVVWCLASVALAIVIGRMVARRDRQRLPDRSVDLPTQQRTEVETRGGSRPAIVHSLASRLLRRR